MISRGTFFVPGPTEVHPDVLAAMSRPMISHRGPEFESLFARLQDGLREVFRTTRPVYVSTSSATGLMEAAVRCAPRGPILSLANGAFAERFAEIARSCGRDTRVIAGPWGGVPDLAQVEAALAGARYAAMTVVHSETSTGALCDVARLAQLAHRYGAMILVDSVSAVGGAPVETDTWELDFVFGGSQKALALPPGLAFGVASAEFVRHAHATPARGRYLDVVELEACATKNQTPATPALSLMFALDAQLGHVRSEGVEQRWARHAEMLRRVEAWAVGEGLELVAGEGSRSPTVSAVRVPPSVSVRPFVTEVAGRGFVIGGGYGKIQEQTFRIGHMGDHTPDGLASCLAACGEALRAVGRGATPSRSAGGA